MFLLRDFFIYLLDEFIFIELVLSLMCEIDYAELDNNNKPADVLKLEQLEKLETPFSLSLFRRKFILLFLINFVF